MTSHPAHYLTAFALLVATAFPAMAADNPTVNGKPISPLSLELMVKAQKARGQADTPELRAQLKRQLVSLELLAQEGSRLGLDKNPEVKNEIEMARKEILSRAMVADFAKKNPPKEEDINAEYANYKTQIASVKEYRAHQLVFDKEEQAKDVIAKLKAGEKFEDLAKLSKDAATAKGGELDWAQAGKYPEPFAKALSSLQKGQVTNEPVKTQYGYHVIRLDDSRPVRVATLEEARPNIIGWLTQQKLQARQQELAKKARVQY